MLPTLPTIAPLTAVAVAAVLWWLHRRGRLTVLRSVVGVTACLYGAAVLARVLLPLTIDTDDPRPWRTWVHLTPLVDAAADPIGIVLNIVLFVPLGLLLPLLVRVGSWRRAVLWGGGVSLGLETLQLLGSVTVSPGRIADVDDLIGNTVGAALGYLLHALLVRMPALGRLARRAALPPTP